ncbi:hypothetical protein BD309DRAFT_927506 [Dichomitus squalens]|uniref:Fungal-type protein kinase domain-containing protein n=1 Tax=Dichomitus squalens TaxID=114155 RepID=A0A4Q9PRG1_9APHY|nr:hypothetical protein BD309DRAFT_927506 [Dichomitus squalens]TBU56972.1 hypothetical protein BD310DRAFT_1040148 [Dichomitus squalens]
MEESVSDVESTPLNPRKADSLKHNIDEPDLEEFRAKNEEEMRAHYVGTGSVEEFLDGLLPYRPRTNKRPPLPDNPFATLKEADSWVEAKVVDKFNEALKTHSLCPKLAFRRSQHRPHPKNTDETGQKIDGGFFRLSEAPDDGRPHWELQLVQAEFKGRKDKDKYDPFADGETPLFEPIAEVIEPSAETRTEVRGQIITYAEQVFAMQHRTFVFMLLVMGRRFRLIRWDRSGAIVTRAVDYYESPGPLCEFLWRISHVKPVALGLDPSATRLTPNSVEFETMTNIAKDTSRDLPYHAPRIIPPDYKLPEGYWFKYVREMFAESISNPEWLRYRLEVVCNGEIRSFLVGRPCFRARALAGRGTRGYVAYDVKGDRFVWLKDCWRASYDLLEKEGDILQRIRNECGADVSVPTVVCHGDVPLQATLTADWWEHKHPLSPDDGRPLPPSGPPPRRSSRITVPMKRKIPDDENEESNDEPAPNFRPDCPLRHHEHYRLVVEQVCMPLKNFLNGKQLVSITSDCVLTHGQVFEKLNILHRDISDSNILIHPKVIEGDGGLLIVWKGILADWEISKPVSTDVRIIARQPERTGTWHFLSINLINNTWKLVTVADELESLIYVLIYYAVRYLRSSLVSREDVARFLDDTYDAYSIQRGELFCGERKVRMVTNGTLSVYNARNASYDPIVFNSPMDKLINPILKGFRARYNVMQAQSLPTRRPPLATVRMANKVNSHKWIKGYLELCYGDSGWSGLQDKAGDRVPSGWESNRKPIPTRFGGPRS